jgi:hypothetical protein
MRGILTSALAAVLIASLVGCVTKSQAKLQAKEAYLAGQEQAMSRLMQSHGGPTVSVIGPVRVPAIAWTEGLTVAKAIVAAGYEGKGDPKQIVILRNGYAIPVETKQLLSGEYVPLQQGDLLQITP